MTLPLLLATGSLLAFPLLGWVVRLSGRIDDLRYDVAALQRDVAALQRDVDDLRYDVAALRRDLEAARGLAVDAYAEAVK